MLEVTGAKNNDIVDKRAGKALHEWGLTGMWSDNLDLENPGLSHLLPSQTETDQLCFKVSKHRHQCLSRG